MSRISDTRLRTRQAAAKLVANGRRAHNLTVDLIYAEIRQGSRTTINDELKLWKDEQARVDALSAALPPAVANAMISAWAVAVEHGERVFAERHEEMEAELATAVARAEALAVANEGVQGEVRALRAQLNERQAAADRALSELAGERAAKEGALGQLQNVEKALASQRDEATQALADAKRASARELEALRAALAEREAAARAEIDKATERLEGVQKHVMLQANEAREAQRRAETTLTKVQQRNEQLVSQVQQFSAEAASQQRLAERMQQQFTGATEESRELRKERDALAQQLALLQGRMEAQSQPTTARTVKQARG
ncbi:DNA-binding protein [Cupriavidus sp. TMH.W2]|uniref:DNA-binding protein n=1 Tax=Cupriavidus sp. TMH.W2 TaxID=3434465 RepID=UPI003D77CF14